MSNTHTSGLGNSKQFNGDTLGENYRKPSPTDVWCRVAHLRQITLRKAPAICTATSCVE